MSLGSQQKPMGGLPSEPISDSYDSQTVGSQIGDHRLSTSCGVVGNVVMTLLIR